MADDFYNDEFWDGEEEGYFDESRFPRVWLLAMGVLSVFLVVGVVALAFLALFRPISTPTPVLSPTEGLIPSPTEGPVLSPTEGPVLSPDEDTPTPMVVQGTSVPSPPALTPIPAVPAEIAIGIYVKVSGTEGTDLSFRAGPSTNHARLKIVAEGSVLKVLGGPSEADGYTWWKLQDVSDGMVGWAVADYLEPTVP